MRTFALLLLLAAWIYGSEGIVTTNVKVRGGPNTRYESSVTLLQGAKVKIIETDGDFYRVSSESGYEGYVAAQYVNIIPEKSASEKAGIVLISSLIAAYLIFSLIVGQMMVRAYMMNWYRNQIWIIRTGPDPIMAFTHQLLRRVSFEVSVGLISIAVGGLFGWIYLIARTVNRKDSERSAAVEDVS